MVRPGQICARCPLVGGGRQHHESGSARATLTMQNGSGIRMRVDPDALRCCTWACDKSHTHLKQPG